VPAEQSMRDCGDRGNFGKPDHLVFDYNLDEKLAKQTRDECMKAAVSDKPLWTPARLTLH